MLIMRFTNHIDLSSCEANKKTAFHFRAYCLCHLCLSVERDSHNRVEIKLRYQDEYRELVRLLGDAEKAVAT